jgi:hypothetical protein
MKLQTKVKVYQSNRQFQRNAKRMAKQGWRVVSTAQDKPRPGCGRIGCLGIFAGIFPPKERMVVTYQRDKG